MWHPPTERALASGVLAAAMSIGGAIGAALTGWLLLALNWRVIFVLYAIPGLLWAVAFWFWFRETPEDHPGTNEAERTLIATGRPPAAAKNAPRGWLMWATLLTSPATWLICGQQFFRAAGYAFFASWFATYLQETRGVSTAASGMLTVPPLLAIVLASTIGGGVSDHIYRATGSLGAARKGVSVVTLLLCALLVFSAYFVRDAALAVAVISLGVFCSGFAGPCAYAVTIDMGGRNVAALFSTMNMIGNFGAGLLPWFVPRFRHWIDDTPTLLSWAGGSSWNAVLVLFSAIYLAAAIGWLALRTKGSVFDQSLLPAFFFRDQKLRHHDERD
jgi:nitrate/nitrite transporter NarK